LQQQLRSDRKRTFELAGVPAGQIRHPDKAKRELRAVKSVPVFPDMEDWSTDLISMQFDMMSPLHNVQRFAGKRERAMKTFESAVSISVSDEANKMFLSCFAPDDQMLEELEGAGEDVPRIGDEYHELLREYVIREAGAGAHQQDSKEEESRPRATRTFVVTTEGEGNSEVVGLSGIPTTWLMAPRPSTWTPLAHPALELRREPLSRDIKRRRRERIVEELSSGG
jgi:Paf1